MAKTLLWFSDDDDDEEWRSLVLIRLPSQRLRSNAVRSERKRNWIESLANAQVSNLGPKETATAAVEKSSPKHNVNSAGNFLLALNEKVRYNSIIRFCVQLRPFSHTILFASAVVVAAAFTAAAQQQNQSACVPNFILKVVIIECHSQG